MDIPNIIQKRWWFCKKAGAQNSITIAKWFARKSELEVFKTYRAILIRLAEYAKTEHADLYRYALTHDLLVDVMLTDIMRLYGAECWRIVKNNIAYIYKIHNNNNN